MKIEKASDLKNNLKVHIAVYGDTKIGKTHLIKTLPGKIIMLNADKGMVTLLGCKNIDFITCKTEQDVIAFMKYITSDKMEYDSVAIDSITVIGDIVLQALEDRGVGGFDLWKSYGAFLTKIITTLRDSDTFNSLSIFELHSKEDSNGLLTKNVGLYGALSSRAGYYYDALFAMRKTKEGRQLQTEAAGGYICGFRGKANLDKFEEPNLEKIIQKITG